MLVDSHAHLDSPDFQSDLQDVLRRAADAGVDRILTIGCVGADPSSISPVLDLVENYPQIFAALGVHPHDARFYSAELGEKILELMSHPSIVGWGEIGLDFHYQNSPPDRQRQAFRSQLRLARQAQKPVIIHSREAEEETCRILEEEFSEGPGGILHCFTHSLETAVRCLPHRFYVSFAGILTFPQAQHLREIAGQLPDHRLLVETDAPYLAPVPFRGRRNEPAFAVKVAETLAHVRGVTLEQMAETTTANFERLFRVSGN